MPRGVGPRNDSKGPPVREASDLLWASRVISGIILTRPVRAAEIVGRFSLYMESNRSRAKNVENRLANGRGMESDSSGSFCTAASSACENAVDSSGLSTLKICRMVAVSANALAAPSISCAAPWENTDRICAVLRSRCVVNLAAVLASIGSPMGLFRSVVTSVARPPSRSGRRVSLNHQRRVWNRSTRSLRHCGFRPSGAARHVGGAT